MRSVLSKNYCEKKEKPFPKLMQAPTSGCIVLMESRCCGTIVHGISHLGGGIGCHSFIWTSEMKDYEGDVYLTNSED